MDDIRASLEGIRRRHGLSRLYLIGGDDVGEAACFGVRPATAARSETLASDLRACLAAARPDSPSPSDRVEVFGDPAQEVERVLRVRIAPYVETDGGTVSVQRIDEAAGLVVVSLSGACAGCPSSVVTLKVGIQRALASALPWVREVVPSEPPREPDFGFKL